MDTKQRFVLAVQEHFATLAAMLTADLGSAVRAASTYDPKFLLVEYDSPQFSENFAVSLWAMDAGGEAMDDGRWLLKGKAVVVPADIYEADEYESIVPWRTGSELLEEWLISRWPSTQLPAFIGHHDSHFKRSLRTGEVVTWNEIIESVDS